ncbi:hypothetical protein Btru_039665 [Bulinus truncatus]|nr:hypothetical protein Btru_039665 [Bulinus truncatus]
MKNREWPYLDLHGMRRRVAKFKVTTFIDYYRKRYEYGGGDRRVEVVTGRGAHSPRGYPVLKMDTIQYLEDEGYRYQIFNLGGSLLVDLKRKRIVGPHCCHRTAQEALKGPTAGLDPAMLTLVVPLQQDSTPDAYTPSTQLGPTAGLDPRCLPSPLTQIERAANLDLRDDSEPCGQPSSI